MGCFFVVLLRVQKVSQRFKNYHRRCIEKKTSSSQINDSPLPCTPASMYDLKSEQGWPLWIFEVKFIYSVLGSHNFAIYFGLIIIYCLTV
jgi:hypothetical protein